MALSVKFPHVNPSIQAELKKRVNEYFEQAKTLPTGNFKLYSKAIFLLLAFFTTYTFLIFIVQTTWVSIGLCVLLGIILSSIGFNVMHDGAHGSFSTNRTINKIAAATLDFLGGSSFMWNIKHNILHHTYTNIEGLDDDIDIKPFMRMSREQKQYSFHRYQHFYFWFLYCLLYLFWVFISDFKKIFSKQIGVTPLKKMTTADYVYFFSMKILYYSVFIIIPIVQLGFLKFVVGYLIFTFIAGFILSIVFQLAHTVEGTSFLQPNETSGLLEDEFAIHQIKTTANFGTGNKLLSWYVGGLNFQVEHHLFPKISHIHYPHINKIVKQICKEWNVQYTEYKTMGLAVRAHILFLYNMGRAIA